MHQDDYGVICANFNQLEASVMISISAVLFLPIVYEFLNVLGNFFIHGLTDIASVTCRIRALCTDTTGVIFLKIARVWSI